MERPAGWKVLTLGVALAGIGVAGAANDVSPAPVFDQPQVLASGGHGHGHGHWGDWGYGSHWGTGWYPNVGGCIGATGPYGNISAGVCF